MENNRKDRSQNYLNPYFGGVLLGIVLILTFYITGRGLGASGAAKSTVVTTIQSVAPEYAKKSHYVSQFISDDNHPMNNWLVFEVLGVFAGAFLSGTLYGRLKPRVEHSPKITSKKRLVVALLGGLLFGFGSQVARGCTSGAALSGMAVLSFGGIITMMGIFGSAYLFSWIFKRLWI
ncbi:MAG: YeeE/YedE thiosulfate transporter family protein [Bacteroidales bacterium]|nr:YeeE/YedE thiosulfate transporter family protein [Bacteroidales bacterium]